MYPEYDDYFSPPVYCRECDEHQSKLLDIGYWMKGVLECLYNNMPLDTLELEHCLQEMCVLLNMKLPREPLMIAKVISRTTQPVTMELSQFISSWIATNKNKQNNGAIV
jgi:hypothetical protein